jgi:hypothetical protein
MPTMSVSYSNFSSGQFPVSVWAAIIYGSHTLHVIIVKRTEEQRSSKTDKFGPLVHQIMKPYLVHFVHLSDTPLENAAIEDRPCAHA